MKCDTTNKIQRMVRGNAFALRVHVKAFRVDGSEVPGFVLSQDDNLLLTTGNTFRPIPFEIEDGNNAIVRFNGSLVNGYYGLDFSGVYLNEEWRWSAKNIFQIVDQSAQGSIMPDGIIYDDTYFIETSITLAQFGQQADWDEINPASQSYIRNKPDIGGEISEAVNAEKTRAQSAENALQTAIANEAQTRQQEDAKKQNTIEDLDAIRTGAAAGAMAYQKPQTGIPSTDMSQAVQASLQKADTALQTESDPTVPNWAKQPQKPSYNAGDVGALPASTKYGATIDLSLNPTTYVLTISLKDQDGTVLNSKTADLPIESMVVNGSYDSQTKKIILTLQSGSTIDVPVGDLVAGLQTEITALNMLDADLVDDTNSTHKFVTAQEKQTWNNKSDFSGSYNDLTDKPVIPDTSGLEQAVNKVTSLSAQSTDVQYPSAKCVYDMIGNVETLLASI